MAETYKSGEKVKYRLAEAIKSNGAIAILQLSHGGLQANGAAVPGQEE